MQFYDHEHVVECIQWAPDKALRYITEAEQDHPCKFILVCTVFMIAHIF